MLRRPRSARARRSPIAACLLPLLLPGLAAWCCLPTSAAPAAEAEGAARLVPVTVDPRVELMGVIFRLAGNPEYSRCKIESYAKAVDEHFGPFRDHEVVKLARNLRRTRGVSFDAVMSMAVHVTDAYKLEERVPLDPRPPSLDARWRPDEAREFLAAARRFVKDASFKDFIEKHQKLYQGTVSRLEAVLAEHGHLEWFDEFFGPRPGAGFKVFAGLLNGPNCYGARCAIADGKEELYCVLGVWKTDLNGMPAFDRTLVGTVVHEFCHSYTNPIVDRHEAELKKAGEAIFPYVAAAMGRQAYGNWKTMMYESLVRACTVRYTRRHQGAMAAWLEIQNDAGRKFLWVGDLAGLLGEYEKSRDKYPTLEDFAPRIVAFFDDYAPKFAKAQGKLEDKRPKVVSITPANGAADVDPALKQIQVVFDRPMKDGSWSMVGGGPNFPEIAGKPSYDRTGKVWTVPIKLKPNWSYRFMLNSDRFQSFQSRDGTPLDAVTVTFQTRNAP